MKNLFTHKMRGRSPIEIAGIILFGAVAITGLAILFGYIIMWLWNWLMPDIFGLPALTYWQAVGLFILLKVLIGGCGSSGGGSCSSEKSSKKNKGDSKTDFSKWKHYDQFWKEEGDELYKNYKERLANPADESEPTAPDEPQE